MPDPIVIVGAALAGLRAAESARRAGHDGRVVMVGAEPHPPYSRPPLSKEVLTGGREPGDCTLRAHGLELEWRLGTAATGLDLGRREVTLADGGRLRYDRLLIATGARARIWSGAGADLEGVFTLRDVEDAQALRAALAAGPRVVVIGAGFLGCEVAASARSLGLDVTLVEIASHPMGALGPELGARVAALHRAHGVELRLETGLAAIEGAGRVEAVLLSDGSRVDADVAVIALGAIPNTEWLAGSGLELEPAVRCEPTLQARGAPGVFCAGDVAAAPHELAGGEAVRLEHWTDAAEQGLVAGRNLVAETAQPAVHPHVPYFWSDQHGVKIQAAGLMTRAQGIELVEASPDGSRFVAVGVRDGRVVAVVAFDAPSRLRAYRARLAEMPPLDELAAGLARDERALGDPGVLTG